MANQKAIRRNTNSMLCLIADIKTKVPATGGMSSRCRAYEVEGNENEAEIVIDDSNYNYDYWKNEASAAYMSSGIQFYYKLLDFDGMMLHASATVINGEAYLFAGQCCIGKSTHANLLMKNYPGALLINDDKPAIRLVDGKWMAYGTPWSGKHGININAKYPLKAICLLTTNRERNEIRVAQRVKSVAGILSCSLRRRSREDLLKLTPLADRLIRDIPIYEMDSLANDESAHMAYNTMKK